MTSITLPSQSFQPAAPLGLDAAARALGVVTHDLAALLRGSLEAVTRRMRALSRAAAAAELRERALAYGATDPSFAADLRAAADLNRPVVEQA